MTVDRAAQVAEVIAHIEGGMSEHAACAKVGINRATFRAAALKHGAGDDYARALTALAQDQVEKLEVTIEDMREGRIDAQMARVEIDARKWFASKFLPKRYGEHIQMEHSGTIANLTEEAIESRLAQLVGKAGTPDAP
jgi:hypothetical protein